mgnify:CR=1 FL=1|tara:strand:+ start:29289 stop:29642 length:354 start_codon:yes stop_codon:yes gene_type:complete
MALNAKRLKGSSIVEVVMAIAIIGAVIGVGSIVFVNINQSANTLQDINEEGQTLTGFINHRILLEDQSWYPNEIVRTDLIDQEFSIDGNRWIESRLIDDKKRVLWKFEVPQIEQHED